LDRPDAQLVALSQRGDENAFAELVTRYQQKVYTLAVRLLHDREESRDVAQEVFLRVYRGLPGFREGAGFAPWLYAIAVNVARDRWRRRKREVGEVFGAGEGFSLEELPKDQPTPEQMWEEKEVRRTVEQAVAALPWDYRIAIVLRHFQDLSYEEIARSLELPVNTVKTRIRRGACC